VLIYGGVILDCEAVSCSMVHDLWVGSCHVTISIRTHKGAHHLLIS
jgi:hypothetical protein